MTRPCSGALSATSASSFGGSALGFFEPVFFALRGMTASYAKIAAMAQERRTLDATAFALTIKWIYAEVSFVMQAAIGAAVRGRVRVHLRRARAHQRFAHVGVHPSYARAHRARPAFLRARRAPFRTTVAGRAGG